MRGICANHVRENEHHAKDITNMTSHRNCVFTDTLFYLGSNRLGMYDWFTDFMFSDDMRFQGFRMSTSMEGQPSKHDS